MNYDEIDWTADRPDADAFASDWNATIISLVQPTDSRLAAIAQTLESTHVNGGAEVAQFRLDTKGAAFWFLSRNRLSEVNFFKLFFSHPNVVQAFPLISPPNELVSEFAMEGSFTAIGRLAEIMSTGGAYKNLKGKDADVWRLALDFADGAFGGRYSTTLAWVNWSAWSQHFCDVAWDGTFLFFDKVAGMITVLMFTDTD